MKFSQFIADQKINVKIPYLFLMREEKIQKKNSEKKKRQHPLTVYCWLIIMPTDRVGSQLIREFFFFFDQSE